MRLLWKLVILLPLINSCAGESRFTRPIFIQEPQDVIFPLDLSRSEIILSCTASGYPSPHYRWKQNGTDIDFSMTYHYRLDGGSLAISSPRTDQDIGIYQCLATNPVGTILSRKAKLQFAYIEDFETKSRSTVSVREGQGVVLLCGPPPHFGELSYDWTFNDNPLYVQEDKRRFVSQNTGNLYIAKVEPSDVGNYTCFVTNKEAHRSVQGPPTPLVQRTDGVMGEYEPKIEVRFPETIQAAKDSSVKLECFALGNPVPDISWRRLDGSPMPGKVKYSNSQATLEIPKFQQEDEGFYECVAEVNSLGSCHDRTGCDPQERMVLDSGTQVYEQAPPSPPASSPSQHHKLKPSNRNGPPLYPWPQSLAMPLALAVPSALQHQTMWQTFSKLHLEQRSHMKRSESTYSVNSTGRRGRGKAPLGRGCDPGGGTLRPAASLPHIAKIRKDVVSGSNKSPCMLVALRPTNMDQEREKFFQSHYAYNPQFEYQEPMPMSVLEKYQEASGQFMHQAVGIIKAVLEKFGTYENFEAATGGQLLTKCQIWSIVRRYMQKEGCVGEVVVQLSEDLLSQAVMMVENSRPTLAINLTGARQYWLEGMLRHEIGTHYLRGVNNSRQPWHSTEGRQQYGLRPANPTEEGLASLHSVLFRKQPFLWRAALLYYTIHQAAHMSFRQLFQDLEQYVQDEDVRWEYCVRAKRGQTDTSLPGCFSKDQVYLDGILRILRHRQTIDFQLLTSLGKVSYEDVEQLRPHGVLDKTRVPHFMKDLDRYRQQLEHIMTTNRLDEAELGRLLPD